MALRRSDQRSSSRRSTYNGKALFDVPEIDNIWRMSTSSNNSGNTLLKALKLWRNIGERIKRTTKLYSQWFINKIIIFFYLFCLQLIFCAYENFLRTNLAHSVGPNLLLIPFSCKSDTTKSSTAMAFRKSCDFSDKDSIDVVFAKSQSCWSDNSA